MKKAIYKLVARLGYTELYNNSGIIYTFKNKI